MVYISLRELTDDILLLVRNSNVSESEDLSRGHIHSWIRAYKDQIWKEEKDKRKLLALQNKLDWDDAIDNEFIKKLYTGPHKLEEVKSNSNEPIFTKRTVEPLKDVIDNSPKGILAIYDQLGEVILYMDNIRRHYNYWRKYTFGEMSAFYKDDGHIYVQGLVDKNLLEYIYVLWIQEVENTDEDGEDENGPDEDDVKIPAWMVAPIKERILKNELAFMLNRPSDDSNNATLASVKPHGPQDDEE